MGRPMSIKSVNQPMPPRFERMGIVAAMHDEIAVLIEQMGAAIELRRIGMRDYYCGQLHGQSCVVVLARVGKVAAAATTVTLIRDFDVDAVVFLGLAGGLGENVKVGDVVVANRLVQHDLDSRPLFPRYEVPLLGRAYFVADPFLSDALHAAADQCLKSLITAPSDQSDHQPTADSAAPAGIDPADLAYFGITAPAVHVGLIASGDQFIAEPSAAAQLRADLDQVMCVEMEGAALAQVCYEYAVPFAVLRTVSDRADHTAQFDFVSFLSRIARHYSSAIVRRFLESLGNHSVIAK
jgi:adenosylhomocysteine nucleosidase